LPKAELDEEELILQAVILAKKYRSPQRLEFYLSVKYSVVDGYLAQANLLFIKFQNFVEEEERLSAWDELSQQSISLRRSQNALYL
jgi:hypothetical protein